MRKFTKGLLMTFIASAVSLGSYAQDAPNGYYRVINAGYLGAKGTGVINVTSPTTAQPQAKKADAITMPGTVLYIATEPIDQSLVVDPTPGLEYVDFTANDLLVKNLRSQAVDASAAVYGKMVETLRAGLTGSLSTLNSVNKWGLSDDQKKEIIEEMFSYMQMYLEPTKTKAGEDAWYLKSTTPNTRPLVQALGGNNTEESLWEALLDGVKTFCEETEQADLWLQWESFFHYSLGNYANRIHMGHTYYLIGGRVDTNFNTHTQIMNPGNGDGTEFISFANNNTVDYPQTGYDPEIEVAGDYAKWIIEEIVPGTKAEGTNYFGMDAFIKGNDGHYYGTLYVDFPMEIVDNGENTVRVWGIQEAPQLGDFPSADPANAVVGYATTKEYTGTVPARTPVVIECLGKSHTQNFLQPAGDPVEADLGKAIQEETDRSFLRGIFFSKSFEGDPDGAQPDDEFYYCVRPLNENGTVNKGTPIARKLIRVFNEGKNKKNPLGFFKYNGSTMKANRAFMILDESMAEANIAIVDYETWLNGITEVSTNNVENNTIYDIQGRIVNNPTKGLYIVNGKKMVIK
ncbi:MAG: hypothetical protein IKI36_03580 [Prevotella sp.]|nr:hypothetical protein [Prevotella sp.]